MRWGKARRACCPSPGERQYFIRPGSHIQLQLVFRAKTGMSRYHQSLVRSGSCYPEVPTRPPRQLINIPKTAGGKRSPHHPSSSTKDVQDDIFWVHSAAACPPPTGWPPPGTMNPLNINTGVLWDNSLLASVGADR